MFGFQKDVLPCNLVPRLVLPLIKNPLNNHPKPSELPHSTNTAALRFGNRRRARQRIDLFASRQSMLGKDKDYRYMATSDLLNELNKEASKVDVDMEIKLCNIILQQLDDSAFDVSGLAVSQARLLEMTSKLSQKLLNERDLHRDVASIALKTIIAELKSAAIAHSVVVSLIPHLIKGITEPAIKLDIKCECLDILSDVLQKYGNLIVANHEELLSALLAQLNSSQASVRKKTILCLACLASSLSDDLLTKATVEVVGSLQHKPVKAEITRTNIQMIGALSRAVGYRFGPYLGDTVPLLLHYCKSASENDEELRECPRDISPYCDQILYLALEYLSYDPNFTDNMEEDTDDQIYDEDEDDESANEYTDDEDVSWKVRRAAAKCLTGFIISRPEMLMRLYEEACPNLIERFKEREENVKMDVFNTFIELLRQTGNVSQARLLEMTGKLSQKLLNEKDLHRDVASIALKTIVAELTSAAIAQSVVVSLIPHLIKGITEPAIKLDIKCECLDILSDVLQKYGNLIAANHEELLSALLAQLNSSQASVRKKTILCLACLASSLSDDLLTKATVEVVGSLQRKPMKAEITRTNIQMIGALSRAVGYRFGPYLGDTVPLLLNYCKSASENDEELRECPRDISPYCDQILYLALEFLSYDPNFTDNMEEDTDDQSYDEDEDDESANEYTDDEDVSWKVRRAAAKCLTGFIVSRPEMLMKLYEEACPNLIERFKEREENVKMDVFNTFIELLQQTDNVTKEVPKIVKSINRQLREKSIKTKVGAFSLLKELVTVLPDCLADEIGSLVPGIEKALLDKSSSSNLKNEALAFTRLVLASHSPNVFHPYVKALSGPILSAVGERYYKVTAEALRVCGELVRVLRPSVEGFAFDFKPYIHPVYKAIMSRVTNQDQDQEVKECAITCMGLVIATFGDNLTSELPTCLAVLLDRMGNEITRLTTVKAFAMIASSPLQIDMSSVLENVTAELTAFLRKANRALRQATLGTLNSIVAAYGDKLSSSTYEVIVVELSTLISDSDLHMTALALDLCCTLMTDQRSSLKIAVTVRDRVLPQALTLIRSSLLQGQALVALQNLFASLVHSANTSFESLLDSLLSSAKPSPQSGGAAKQALHSIAQCVAVLCLAAGDRKCSSTVSMLTDVLRVHSNTNSAKQHLALLCLGEIGRRKDISSHVHIENIIIESFQSPFEEIKSAASYALGNIAVGNLQKYLPFILDQIDNQQRKQYLLLHSLKEVIVRQSVDKAEFQESSVDKILNLLFNHCESEEEGVRNVVAECLGKIALMEPAKLVPALKVRTTSSAAFTRATVVIAIKYSLVERPEKIDEILYPEISSFLMLIKDHDR
ncbi:Cullin-associated NEDD8-dissociated protein 1-like protein, partial [Drosera capensis]